MNYFFNGLVIASEIEFTILPKANDHQATVFINFGTIPQVIDNPIRQSPTYIVSQQQTLIKLPNIGFFLIEKGTHITVEPAKNLKQTELCTFILGVAWAAISYQQGKSLLKGALLSIENQNWLISGLSPIGISTFALAMQTYCNARILSDEFCSYQTIEHEVLLTTGIPALKLWQNTLNHFGVNNQKLSKIRSGLNKYWLPLTDSSTEKKPLNGIVTLREWRSDKVSPVGIKQQTGFKALKKTYQHSFHPAYMTSQHNLKQKFQQDLLLTQKCKINSFTIKRDFSYLQDNCQYLHQWITND